MCRFWVLSNTDRPRGAARGAAAGAVSYLLSFMFLVVFYVDNVYLLLYCIFKGFMIHTNVYETYKFLEVLFYVSHELQSV